MRIITGPLASQAIAMFPAVLASSFSTKVIKFLNDTEQRFVANDKLFSCTLQYHAVDPYDMNLIRKFFNDMDGMYISNDLLHSFSITIDGSTYNNCGFGQDILNIEENRGGTYSFELKILQVAPNGATGT